MAENMIYVAKDDESDISVTNVQIHPMGSYVSFVGNMGITDEKGSSSQTVTMEGILLKADISVEWDKGDNPLSSGKTVYSVTYDIQLVTDEADETDIVYKSVKSDKVSVI